MSPSEIDNIVVPPIGRARTAPGFISWWRPEIMELRIESHNNLGWRWLVLNVGGDRQERVELDAEACAHLAAMLTGEGP